jgi:hypothetical protein
MSLEDIEEKFSMAQLALISTLQSISLERQRDEMKQKQRGRGRVVNRKGSKEQRNLQAFKLL